MLRTGGWVTVSALVPLALGLAGDAYVVFTRIFGTPAFGGTAAASGLIGLRFALPMAARRSRGVPGAANRAGEVPRHSAE